LFIGIDEGVDDQNNDPNKRLRGDLAAEALRTKMIEAGVIEEENATILSGNSVSKHDIIRALAGFNLDDNDKLILYLGGHSNGGVEIKMDEIFELDRGTSYLSDDELSRYVRQYTTDSTEKWIIADSCNSGGYWAGESDQDLSDLSNIAFISPNLSDLAF